MTGISPVVVIKAIGYSEWAYELPPRCVILEPANTSLLAAQDEADSRRHTYRKIPSQLVVRSMSS